MDTFKVDEETEVDYVQWMRMEEDRGWICVEKPGVGKMCEKVERSGREGGGEGTSMTMTARKGSSATLSSKQKTTSRSLPSRRFPRRKQALP